MNGGDNKLFGGAETIARKLPQVPLRGVVYCGAAGLGAWYNSFYL